MVRAFLFLVLLLPPCLCIGDEPEERPRETPDLDAVRAKCLDRLKNVVPAKSGGTKEMTVLEFRDGAVRWGPLFSADETVALVNFYDSEPREYENYPPYWLSLLAWRDQHWEFRQFLGSASKLEIFRRKDLGLQIVQGQCRTGRYQGEKSSWKYDPASKSLLPTHLDDWGPYVLKGGFICYCRGIERRAHWDTRWIYPFNDGKKGELLACLHQVDTGSFVVSFADPKTGAMRHWAFRPDLEHPDLVKVSSSKEEDSDTGETLLGELHVVSGGELEPTYCFELLTGLSSDLLTNTWSENVPKPHTARIKIEASGDPELIEKFHWPPPKKRTR